FQAEDGIRDRNVTGVQTCALPILIKYFTYYTFPAFFEILPGAFIFHCIAELFCGPCIGHFIDIVRELRLIKTGRMHNLAECIVYDDTLRTARLVRKRQDKQEDGREDEYNEDHCLFSHLT